MTSNARTKARLDKLWPLVLIVERFNPHVHIRQDAFGFIDVLCWRGDETLAIQACSGKGDAREHLRKLQTIPRVLHWLSSPTRRLEIWAWRKVGAKGKRKLWDCRVENVILKQQENGAVLPDFET